MNDIYWLIFLRTGDVLVSRKQYASWEEIQDAYEDYMTSLQFPGFDELKDWILKEYPDLAGEMAVKLHEFQSSGVEQMLL